MTKPNLVKKLSMKKLVGGNVASFIPEKEIEEQRGDKTVVKIVPDIGATVWIAQVIGIARGVKTGESSFGYWEALMGDFVAIPLVGPNGPQPEKKDGNKIVEPAKEGMRFRTSQLFLPDVVLQMVSAALGNNTGIEFAFKIGITAVSTEGDRPSATGYEYTADFMVEASKNDPLEALLAKALPAPEKK